MTIRFPVGLVALACFAVALGVGCGDEDAAPIPTDLAEAVKLARDSDFLKDLCGEYMYELLLQMCEREVEFVKAQVTPVEVERYLGNI